MRLHYHPASPNCGKVLAACALSGLTPDLVLVDLPKGEQHGPEYRALNANGLVPVLEIEGRVLTESEAILQHLAARAPGLIPDDPPGRDEVLRWQFWAGAHWSPNLRVFVWENLFGPAMTGSAPDAVRLAEAGAGLARYAPVLEGALSDGRKWLVGDRPSIADLSVAAFLIYATPARIPLEPFPAIRSWAARVLALPGWPQGGMAGAA